MFAGGLGSSSNERADDVIGDDHVSTHRGKTERPENHRVQRHEQ
jgi:hypothetical protein